VSKVFEALRRLERESGTLPPEILTEAHQVLNGSAPAPAVTTAPDIPDIPEPDPPPIIESAPGPALHAPAVKPGFSLERVPVVEADITHASRIVFFTDPDCPGSDRFRLLRMRLRPLWETGKLKTLLITSAQAREGKSTVSLNIATTLAEEGKKRVLLIEGDLCHPSLADALGVSGGEGLAECLEAARNPLSLLRRIEPLGWYLLTAGRAQGNTSELLQSPILAHIFDALRPCFDWIVIDTPPVIPLTDTMSLKQFADAGLLVVRADVTAREAVEAAIGRMGTQNLVGILLNGSTALDRLYSDYRKSYDPKARAKRKRK
jgi:capsular exopolysaccharide synthesis family protein